MARIAIFTVSLFVMMGLSTALSAGPATRPTANLNWAPLNKLAEKSDPAAQTEIGRRHLLGSGIAKNESEAAVWFGKAAATGWGDALFELYLCARDGIGMPKDAEKAEKLLMQAESNGSIRARIELADQQTRKDGNSDAAAKQLLDWARDGEPAAQLALGLAISRGVAKSDGGNALQWILKAANGDDERVALAACRVFKDGEGQIRPDPTRAATLLRKLAEQGVRDAHAELAKLNPESYRGLCREQSIERASKDDRLIGIPIRLEGRLATIDKEKWSISSEGKPSVTINPPSETPEAASVGRWARVFGYVEQAGTLRAFSVVVPEPKADVKFELIEPRVMKGTLKEDYVVRGEVKNTGRQHVESLNLNVRVFQEETGKEDTEVLTVTDLAPGASKPFITQFKQEKVKAAPNSTAVVSGEVKVADIKW